MIRNGEAAMAANILVAYSLATEIVGFGRVSSLSLRYEAGLTWGQIHALTDAGLIRYQDAPGGVPVYLLMFP